MVGSEGDSDSDSNPTKPERVNGFFGRLSSITGLVLGNI